MTGEKFDDDPSSVHFAGAKPARRMFRDVDGDGDVGLLLQFQQRKMELDNDSTRAILTGETKDKLPFIGTGAVVILLDE